MMGRLNGSWGCCPIRSGFDEVVPGDHRVREIAWRPGSIVGCTQNWRLLLAARSPSIDPVLRSGCSSSATSSPSEDGLRSLLICVLRKSELKGVGL